MGIDSDGKSHPWRRVKRSDLQAIGLVSALSIWSIEISSLQSCWAASRIIIPWTVERTCLAPLTMFNALPMNPSNVLCCSELWTLSISTQQYRFEMNDFGMWTKCVELFKYVHRRRLNCRAILVLRRCLQQNHYIHKCSVEEFALKNLSIDDRVTSFSNATLILQSCKSWNQMVRANMLKM